MATPGADVQRQQMFDGARQVGMSLGEIGGFIPSTGEMLTAAFPAAAASIGAAGTPFAMTGAGLASSLGVAPVVGGIGNAAATPLLGGLGGGLGALGAAMPYIGLGLGALTLLSAANRKPSVGPNFNVRYSGSGGSNISLRDVGVDNNFPRGQAQEIGETYATRLSDLLGRVGGTAVDNGLNGTFGYNMGRGGYFTDIDGDVTPAQSLDEAYRAFVLSNVDEGRITADRDALMAALGGGGQASVQAMNAPAKAASEPQSFAEFRAKLAAGGYDDGVAAPMAAVPMQTMQAQAPMQTMQAQAPMQMMQPAPAQRSLADMSALEGYRNPAWVAAYGGP